MNKKTVEHYYAIRIGRPGVHLCYWGYDPRTSAPLLFATRQDAKDALDKDKRSCQTVKRVTLTD